MNLTHIESRPSVNNAGKEYDFFMDCECDASVKEDFLSQLNTLALSVRVLARTPSEDEGVSLSLSLSLSGQEYLLTNLDSV